MKIATFNINNVNKRLPGLPHWLKTARPDIVCLQELKYTDKDFPAAPIKRAGWHYMRNRFARDAGLRLDHLLLSPVLAPQLKSAQVDCAMRGEEDASDHAPVWIELAERAAKKSR
jgi:exonuclease III